MSVGSEKKKWVFFKTLEPVNFEKSKKSKEKEKEENQEKLYEESFNGFDKKNHWNKGEICLCLKSSEDFDLEKAEKKKGKDEKSERWKEKKEEWKLRKKLDRQRTLVGENASDEKEIKSKEDKDGISVISTVEIIVDDDGKKKTKMKEEVSGERSWRKKKQPFIAAATTISVNSTVVVVVNDDNKKKIKMKEEEVIGDHSWRKKKEPSIAAATTIMSNPTAEIVRKFDVIRVVGTDQKGKNRRSMVGRNRGFGGGFGNRKNAKGRGGDDDEKNLMWVKKGENMNSNGVYTSCTKFKESCI